MRQWIVAGLIAVTASACQTTGVGELYSRDTIASQPYRSNYPSELAFVVDMTIYMYPRRCVFIQTSDGVRNSENMRPGQFSFTQVISNKHDDWYRAFVQPTEAVHNALTFYVNGKTGAWACGAIHLSRIAPNVRFEPDKFYNVVDVKAESAGKTTQNSATSATKPPGADAVEILGGDTRTIVMTWEGFEKPVTGLISLRQSRDGGAVNLVLPESITRCSGEFSMTTKSEGVWSITCANGRKASGTLTASGSGKGSTGTGKDDLGRAITYIVGTR
jgi:hypothetical protein